MKFQVCQKITVDSRPASMWKCRFCLIPMYTVTMDKDGIPQEPYPDLYRWFWSKQQAVAAIEQAAAYVSALYSVKAGRQYGMADPSPTPGLPERVNRG